MIAGIVSGLPTTAPISGADCVDYSRPPSAAIATDLDADIVNPTPTAIETNLCSEIV